MQFEYFKPLCKITSSLVVKYYFACILWGYHCFCTQHMTPLPPLQLIDLVFNFGCQRPLHPKAVLEIAVGHRPFSGHL